jgi:hypothetical protein
VCRHLLKRHSSKELLQQIRNKSRPSVRRQSSISSLLSGFDERKLKDSNALATQMKDLLKQWLLDSNINDVTGEAMQTSDEANDFDPTLLEGYREIGLCEL